MQCEQTAFLRVKFIKKLLVELLKHTDGADVNEIMLFREDIMRYLEKDEDDEYETNQHLVGMKELYRGHVAVDWFRTNINSKKYRNANQVIVKECVAFYNECWKHSNNVLHYENKQRERLIKWYEKERYRAAQSEYRQLRLHVDKCEVDVNACQCDAIKTWIMNLKRIEKKVEKVPVNDARRHMLM